MEKIKEERDEEERLKAMTEEKQKIIQETNQ